MATLLLSGIAIVYTLRVNMSVAAQKMRDDLDWSEADKGLVLSSFYWGYTVGQIPASMIAQTYGAKWLFGLSVAIPSLLTLLVPLACRHSFGMALFIRVIIGFFESATFPAVYHFFPIWVPISEKTFMIPYIASGMYLGEIVGFSLSGVLADADVIINGANFGGWPSIFYIFGAMGVVWYPLWVYAAHESPAEHPTISKEEVVIINRGKDMPLVVSELHNDEENGSGSKYDIVKPLLYDSAVHYPTSQSEYYHQAIAASSPSSTRSIDAENQQQRQRQRQQEEEEEQEEEEQLEQGDPSDVNDTAAMDQGNDLPSGGVLHGNTSMDQSTSSIDSGATTPCVTYFSGSHVASPINHNNNHSRSHATTINSTYCPIGKALVLQEEKQQLLIPRSSASASGPGAGNGAGSELISKDSSSEWQIFTEDMYNLNGGKFTKAELRARTPWGMFFTHPVALTLLFANFGYGWIGFTLLSEMPSYLTDILGFNLTSAGFLCVFPYLALFIASLSFGKLFDWLQHEHNWHTLTVRRSAMVVANVASAAVLVMCGYLENKFAAYAFMVATQVFYGAAQAGIGCAYTDAAPTYSSSLNSLGNTMGAMAGILGPIIVAACTEEWSGVYGWRVAFYITFALSCAIVAVWFRVMTADIVPALNTPARL